MNFLLSLQTAENDKNKRETLNYNWTINTEKQYSAPARNRHVKYSLSLLHID